MLQMNSFWNASQLFSLSILYAYYPVQCLTYRRHLNIYWMNELLRAVFKHTRFFPPSRPFLKGLFFSFPFMAWHCPSSWDAAMSHYTCLVGEGKVSHCYWAIECPGLGWGWCTGWPPARSRACTVEVSRSELEIWGHGRSGGWKRTRKAGQRKLRIRS